jgi:hypothetical protein
MRLTRDFTGKASREQFAGRNAAGMGPRAGKPPAWAKELAAKRAQGLRVGLLLVSVEGWAGGAAFAQREGVRRICALPDFDSAAGDWSVAAGLDCLVCADPDADVDPRCLQERFDAAAVALFQAGAASVWGECDVGIMRLALLVGNRLVSIEAPVPPGAFGRRLAQARETAILMEDGVYGDAAYAPVRAMLMDGLGLA